MSRLAIELRVHNHPGVMARITGLFARRAFNLEGILCGPVGDGSQSCMVLLVNEDERLNQVLMHLQNLYDVLEVCLRKDYDLSVFSRLPELGGCGVATTQPLLGKGVGERN